MRFIIGISMVRISCFKHEKEILLYSQTLPIQSTKTFEDNDSILVDQLVYSLMSTAHRITDPQAFLRQIGVRFYARWWVLIIFHSALHQLTVFEDKTVLERLQNELKIEELAGERWSDWQPLRDELNRNSFAQITLAYTETGCKFTLPKDSSGFEALRYFVYSVQFDGIACDVEYTFEDDCYFHTLRPLIPRKHHEICLLVKPDESSNLYVLAQTYQHELFSKYEINQEEHVIIDGVIILSESHYGVGVGRTIDIGSNNTIHVTGSGRIDATATGLCSGDISVAYDAYVQRRLQDIADKKDNTILLPLGTGHGVAGSLPGNSSSAGGGIIALRSFLDIVNDGMLSSNGADGGDHDGGSICLCADGAVINRGVIECRRNGQIIVRCRQFVNDGVISPPPKVLITDGTELICIEMAKPWSTGALKEIPLSVHSHRGHAGDIGVYLAGFSDKNPYHPRNLLETKSGNGYVSRSPSKGDWIVFEVQCEAVFVPKTICIRNGEEETALKTVEISLSKQCAKDIRGDKDDGFDPLMTLDDIQQVQALQYFDINGSEMSAASIWMANYKFIRVKIIDNWERRGSEWDQNVFASFSVIGVVPR